MLCQLFCLIPFKHDVSALISSIIDWLDYCTQLTFPTTVQAIKILKYALVYLRCLYKDDQTGCKKFSPIQTWGHFTVITLVTNPQRKGKAGRFTPIQQVSDEKVCCDINEWFYSRPFWFKPEDILQSSTLTCILTIIALSIFCWWWLLGNLMTLCPWCQICYVAPFQNHHLQCQVG